VMRHMLDGDLVLFNRQPSLHRCVGSNSRFGRTGRRPP
jgi:DNA-directed RNA polymerase beta' subunit